MAKEKYYFQHDYNARNDEMLAAFHEQYKAAGYGVYWVLGELLHESENSYIENTEKKLKIIAVSACKVEYELFQAMLNDLIHTYDLLYIEDGKIYSSRVLRNKNKRAEVREKKKEAGKLGAEKRWQKEQNDSICHDNISNSQENDSKSIAKNGKGKERKVKESKRKDKKENSVIAGGEETSPTLSTKDQTIARRKVWGMSLADYVPEYGRETIAAFYKYWGELTKSGHKMRWEMEKTWEIELRLDTWRSREKDFPKTKAQTQQPQSTGNRKPGDFSNYPEYVQYCKDNTLDPITEAEWHTT